MSTKDKEEIIGRRLFFKKAAKTAIPLLAGIAIMPYFAACDKDESIEEALARGETGGGCSSCGNVCSNGCGSACSNNCSNNCGDSCSNGANNNDNNDVVSNATGTISGHEYVDLGLSVKWARYDIQSTISAGYENPWLIGTHHYVTGYGPDDDGDNGNITQIVSNEHIATSLCGTSLDIAKQEWGNNWRLPSMAEWQELFNKCNTRTIEYHSHQGILFTSKLNGRSIFIPHCWCRDFNSSEMIFIRFSGTVVMGSKPYLSYVWVIKSNGVSSKVKLLQFPLPIRAVAENGGGGGCNNACSNSATNSGCGNCSSNCANECDTTCSGLCARNCRSTCGGGCNEKCVSCTLSCQYVASGACSGCTANCSSFCSTTCRGVCYHSVMG